MPKCFIYTARAYVHAVHINGNILGDDIAYVPVNTAALVPPAIAGAAFNVNGNDIFSTKINDVRNIHLKGSKAVAAIFHKASVKPNGRARCHALKIQNMPFAAISLVYLKALSVPGVFIIKKTYSVVVFLIGYLLNYIVVRQVNIFPSFDAKLAPLVGFKVVAVCIVISACRSVKFTLGLCLRINGALECRVIYLYFTLVKEPSLIKACDSSHIHHILSHSLYHRKNKLQ